MSVSVSLIVLRFCPTVGGKWRWRLRLDSTLTLRHNAVAKRCQTSCAGPGWSRQSRCTARNTESICACTNATQRYDSRSCKNNTPRAVRCQSTENNVPTAPAAASAAFSITHLGRCDAEAPKNVPTATAAAPGAGTGRCPGRRLDRRPLGLDTTDGLCPDARRNIQHRAVVRYRLATARVGASDRNFLTVDPAVADLRTEMRNPNATLVSQLSVKSGLTSSRRDNVSTASHRPRGQELRMRAHMQASPLKLLGCSVSLL